MDAKPAADGLAEADPFYAVIGCGGSAVRYGRGREAGAGGEQNAAGLAPKASYAEYVAVAAGAGAGGASPLHVVGLGVAAAFGRWDGDEGRSVQRHGTSTGASDDAGLGLGTPRRAAASNVSAKTPPATPVTAETARIARRRHRKRLAQIVVGQWKWFAADALAVLPGAMHQSWRTKRRAVWEWAWLVADIREGGKRRSFRAWRAKVRQSARSGGCAGGPLASVRVRLLGESLAALRGYGVRRAKKRRALLHAAIYRCLTTLLRALTRWGDAAAALKRERALMGRAERHSRGTALRGILSAWAAEVWGARRRRLQEARAVGSHQHRSLRRCLRRWMALTDHRRGGALAAAAFAERRERSLAATVLTVWRGDARATRSARAVSAARASAAAAQHARRAASVALSQWSAYVVSRHAKVGRYSDARAHRCTTLVAASCRGWRLYALWSAATREKGWELERRVCGRVCAGVVRAWGEFTRAEVTARAAAAALETERTVARHVRDSLARKVLFGWARAAGAAAAASLVAEAKGSEKCRGVLTHTLHSWRLNAAECATGRAAVERAEDHYDYRVVRLVLGGWRQAVAQLSREKHEDERAFEHYSAALLGRVTVGWAGAAMAARRAKVAAVWWRHAYMRRAVSGWAARTSHKAAVEAQRRVAVRHFYRRRLSDAVAAWRYHLRACRVRDLRLAAADKHFARVATVAALANWRVGPGTCCPPHHPMHS